MKCVEGRFGELVDRGNLTDIEDTIIAAVKQHEAWRTTECIDLHAGKNVMSMKARQLLASPGLVDKSVAGSIGKRNAAGARFIDEVEALAVALLCKLFSAKYTEYRPMSGNMANGIALCAVTRPGDTIMVVPQRLYGHSSWLLGGYPMHLGLQVKEIPFTADGINIDIETFRKRATELKPTLIVVGAFISLFPIPLAEIRQVADSVGAKVMYDGAHVMGLIAGNQFQDPLTEGAHILVGSTQKTLPGPIGGILVSNREDIAEQIFEVTSALISNYGNNRIAALALTAAEMLCFGREYAEAIVSNARALAHALETEGLDVLGKAQGYTASHQVILDASSWGGAKQVVDLLEGANIICTRFALSSDYIHSLGDPNGVRFGVSSVSRLGMGSKEMQEIARFIKELLHDPKRGQEIGQAVRDMAAEFCTVHYSFDSLRPSS